MTHPDEIDRQFGDRGYICKGEGANHGNQQWRLAEKFEQFTRRPPLGLGAGVTAEKKDQEGSKCDKNRQPGKRKAGVGAEEEDRQRSSSESTAESHAVYTGDSSAKAVWTGAVQPRSAQNGRYAGAEAKRKACNEPNPR
ncbi:hypothetical protein T190_12335 [Sinorhizobium meliloti CCBAU 01290]|nr:hypothetical protein T190_12335 [Sinorhizobium meliloti CCBAU 01290]